MHEHFDKVADNRRKVGCMMSSKSAGRSITFHVWPIKGIRFHSPLRKRNLDPLSAQLCRWPFFGPRQFGEVLDICHDERSNAYRCHPRMYFVSISYRVQHIVWYRAAHLYWVMETRIGDRATIACGTACTNISPARAYGRAAVSLRRRQTTPSEVQPTCSTMNGIATNAIPEKKSKFCLIERPGGIKG